MVQVGGNGAGCFCGSGHGLGGQQDQDAIHFRILLGSLQGLDIAFRVSIAKHIDGIAHRGGGRQFCAQGRGDIPVQFRHPQARLFNRIRCHGPGAAGIGDNENTVTLGRRLHGQGSGIIKQGVKGIGPADPGPLESGAVGCFRPGQHTGMAGRRLLTRLRGSRFQDNHRLDVACLFRRLDKPVPGTDIFKIADNDLCCFIACQRLQQIDLGYIGLVADGNKLGKAEMAPLGHIEHGGTEGAGLGEHRNAA